MPNKLDNITNFSNQALVLQLQDGTTVDITLIYQATSERWIMNLSYAGTVINGLGVCCDPNILRQWKNVFPFGIACATDDQTDPFAVDDFSSGRASLFLLTAEDVESMETAVFGRP